MPEGGLQFRRREGLGARSAETGPRGPPAPCATYSITSSAVTCSIGGAASLLLISIPSFRLLSRDFVILYGIRDGHCTDIVAIKVSVCNR
jgi:hypothetical protein